MRSRPSTRPRVAADRGHVAYLGYAGLALGLHRLLVPSSRFDARHDAIAAALARRFAASPTGLVETYPNEVYPVDNAAALGALALHARATHRSARHPASRAASRRSARTPSRRTVASLAQAVDPVTAAPRDPGRGSGSALAAYFLAYADQAMSASLYRAVHRELFRTIIGFGVVLEHPASCDKCSGRVDIDSGPVVFGFGVSATGFASARAALTTTATPSRRSTRRPSLRRTLRRGRHRTFATGGPLGDAILFAMLTAPRAASSRRSRGRREPPPCAGGGRALALHARLHVFLVRAMAHGHVAHVLLGSGNAAPPLGAAAARGLARRSCASGRWSSHRGSCSRRWRALRPRARGAASRRWRSPVEARGGYRLKLGRGQSSDDDGSGAVAVGTGLSIEAAARSSAVDRVP